MYARFLGACVCKISENPRSRGWCLQRLLKNLTILLPGWNFRHFGVLKEKTPNTKQDKAAMGGHKILYTGKHFFFLFQEIFCHFSCPLKCCYLWYFKAIYSDVVNFFLTDRKSSSLWHPGIHCLCMLWLTSFLLIADPASSNRGGNKGGVSEATPVPLGGGKHQT